MSVATTLAGYTGSCDIPEMQNAELVAELACGVDTQVIADSRIWLPEDVAAGFDAGAWSVVVGTAVTNPQRITARLAVRAPASSARGQR